MEVPVLGLRVQELGCSNFRFHSEFRLHLRVLYRGFGFRTSAALFVL